MINKKVVVLILLILCILFEPLAYFVRILINHFAVGLSLAKVYLFLAWTTIILCAKQHKKCYIFPTLLLSIIVHVVSNAYIFYKYQLPLTGQYNFFYLDKFSSTSIGHQHIMKYVGNILHQVTLLPIFDNVDYGSVYAQIVPLWIQILGTISVVLLVYALYTQYPKHKSALYIVASFSVWKNMVDGGFLNFEGAFWLTVLLVIVYPKYKWYFMPITVVPFILYWSKTVYIAPFIVLFAVTVYLCDKYTFIKQVHVSAAFLLFIFLSAPYASNIITDSIDDFVYATSYVRDQHIIIEQFENQQYYINITETGLLYQIARKHNVSAHYRHKLFIPGINCVPHKPRSETIALRTMYPVHFDVHPSFMNIDVEQLGHDKYYVTLVSNNGCYNVRSVFTQMMFDNNITQGIFVVKNYNSV